MAGLVDPCIEMRGLVESVKQNVVAARCLLKELEERGPEDRRLESFSSTLSSVFSERIRSEERLRREQFERKRRASTGRVRLAGAVLGSMDQEEEKESVRSCPQVTTVVAIKPVSQRKFSLPLLREKVSSAGSARMSGFQPEQWPQQEQK